MCASCSRIEDYLCGLKCFRLHILIVSLSLMKKTTRWVEWMCKICIDVNSTFVFKVTMVGDS